MAMPNARVASVVAIGTFIAACATPPPPRELPPGTPQAKLRVAASSTFSTNISLWRAAELKCGASSMGSLGFFHPSASGNWQKDRRYYGFRQDIQVPARVPENMYAEHVISLERPVYVYFNAALTGCAGVVELPLADAGIYEFELAVGPGVCKASLFSLEPSLASSPRAEVALSPPTTGFGCTL